MHLCKYFKCLEATCFKKTLFAIYCDTKSITLHSTTINHIAGHGLLVCQRILALLYTK